MLAGDAFGMELHAMHVEAPVRHAHDEPVSLGRHFELVRGGRAVDDEAVIARRLERPIDAAKQAARIVGDGRKLAVHRQWRAHDMAAEHLADRLMAEADAEQRRARRAPRARDRGRCPLRSACRGPVRAQ